jgi:hypothetical protein
LFTKIVDERAEREFYQSKNIIALQLKKFSKNRVLKSTVTLIYFNFDKITHQLSFVALQTMLFKITGLYKPATF